MKYNNKEIYLKPVTDGFSWYDLESNLPLFRRTFKDTNEANVDLEKYIEFEKTIDKKLDILYRQILSSGLDSWSITLLTNQLGKISNMYNLKSTFDRNPTLLLGMGKLFTVDEQKYWKQTIEGL